MRHFRDTKEIELFLIEEHLRQGIPVVCGSGSAVVPISQSLESGAEEITEFDITIAAQKLWEALS